MGHNIKGNLRNCIVATKHKAYEYYIYSTSSEFDLSLMRKFSSDYSEKYDACIKITDAKKFFNLINETLDERASYQISSKCKYGSRMKHHTDEEVHPALLKPMKHEYQAEVRTIWKFNNSNEPEDIFLEIPELKDLCKIYFTDKREITDGFLGVNRIKGKDFENDSVLIDKHTFDNCTFKSCQLVYRGLSQIDFNNTKAFDCKVTLAGSALRTIDFLKLLNNDNGEGDTGKKTVNKIIDQIRK